MKTTEFHRGIEFVTNFDIDHQSIDYRSRE